MLFKVLMVIAAAIEMEAITGRYHECRDLFLDTCFTTSGVPWVKFATDPHTQRVNQVRIVELG